MAKHESLTEALAAFQADLPKVGKNSTNPHFKSKYASLEDITEVVLPALAKHGLAWMTLPMVDVDRGFVLRYKLVHESGEYESGEWPLPDAKSTAQALGSALTYARRYTLGAVTGIAPDEDDDGNAAQSAKAPKSQPAMPPEVAVTTIGAASNMTELQKIWEQVGRAGATGFPEVIAAKDKRKAELSEPRPDAG